MIVLVVKIFFVSICGAAEYYFHDIMFFLQKQSFYRHIVYAMLETEFFLSPVPHHSN